MGSGWFVLSNPLITLHIQWILPRPSEAPLLLLSPVIVLDNVFLSFVWIVTYACCNRRCFGIYQFRRKDLWVFPLTLQASSLSFLRFFLRFYSPAYLAAFCCFNSSFPTIANFKPISRFAAAHGCNTNWQQ